MRLCSIFAAMPSATNMPACARTSHFSLRGLSDSAPTMFRAKSRINGGNEGSMYPGSFDFERLKKSMGTRAQHPENQSSDRESVAARYFRRTSRPILTTTRVHGRTPSSITGAKNQKGRTCWKTGVRKRAKLCSTMKMRKKSGLRRAHSTYQGSAVAQKAAMLMGWVRRNASRQRFVPSAHKKVAPPARIIAAGPFASDATPRKNPNATRGARLTREMGDCELDDRGLVTPRMTAAQTIARVSMAANGMSGAAAWEKPIIATVSGSITNRNRGVFGPSVRHASQASARVAKSALMAEGKRAEASLTPNNLNAAAAPQ